MWMNSIRRRVDTIRWVGRIAIIALAVSALIWRPQMVLAAPTLTITPPSGPCASQVVLSGAGFDPGIRVGLVARATAPPSGQAIEFATQTVAADGTFRLTTAVESIVPACRATPPPANGTVYTIYVSTPPLADKTGAGQEVTLATATFTLGVTTPGLPNTGGGGVRLTGGQPTSAAFLLGALLVLVAVGASAATRTLLRSRHRRLYPSGDR
jgi:hypothetical protein